MGTAVDFFVADSSFLDHRSPFVSVLDDGGIGRLTQHGLSYFVDAYVARDSRAPSARTVDWVAAYSPTLIIDSNFYQTFITQLEALDATTRTALFQMVDRLLFNPSATGDAEAWLTSTDKVKDLYVPKSLIKPTTQVSNPVYVGDNSTPQQFTSIPFVTFTVALPTGSTTTDYDITVYSDNGTWITRYPNSKIVAVSPPLSYDDLLNLPLTTASANKLASATGTVNLNYNAIAAQIKAEAASGYSMFSVKVIDSANNNTVLAPFLVLYKGAIPTQLEMRQAVKAEVLSSGIGTEEQWRTRIPELFVDMQFYLIPMYDNITGLPDEYIYPSIVNTWKVFGNAGKVLTNVDTTYLQKNTELLAANYEKLLIAGVMDPDSETASDPKTTLLARFPTYQSWSADDANFQYMAPDAQTFSLNLSEALKVALKNGTSATMFPVVDRNVEYVAFVIGNAEYCVVTKESYLELIGEVG